MVGFGGRGDHFLFSILSDTWGFGGRGAQFCPEGREERGAGIPGVWQVDARCRQRVRLRPGQLGVGRQRSARPCSAGRIQSWGRRCERARGAGSLRRRRAGAGARGRGRDAERRGLVWVGAGPAAGPAAWAAVETLGSLTASEEEDSAQTMTPVRYPPIYTRYHL